MAKSKELVFPDDRSAGIQIVYVKSRDVLQISGYFDHFVGIEGTEITFKDFCDKLGIDLQRRRT